MRTRIGRTAIVAIFLLLVAPLLPTASGVDDHDSLLSLAASGDTEAVKRVAKPATVNIHDERGLTPLLSAAQNGHASTVEALLAAGADADSVWGGDGESALFAAAKGGFLETIDVLLRRASVDKPSAYGWTPLIAAAHHGHLEAVRALLSAGAAVERGDAHFGRTALMKASYAGHTKVQALLLGKGGEGGSAGGGGANVDAVDLDGCTALWFAAHRGVAKAIATLLKAGAAVDLAPPETGATPLLAAAAMGHVRAAEKLLDAGADPARTLRRDLEEGNPPVVAGSTALDAARTRGHERVEALLVRAMKRREMKRRQQEEEGGGQRAAAAAGGGEL